MVAPGRVRKPANPSAATALICAVANALLEAMTPAQLEIALVTFEAVETQARQFDPQWQRQLERARYEADLARRRYLAVDPDNRLPQRLIA